MTHECKDCSRREFIQAGAGSVAATLFAGYSSFAQDKATRLAKAETFQRTRAEGLLQTVQSKQTELELKQAEHYFESDDAGKGVAYLARMLRQNPSNHIAAARLMSALTDRSFALPLRIFRHTQDIQEAEFSPDGQRDRKSVV